MVRITNTLPNFLALLLNDMKDAQCIGIMLCMGSCGQEDAECSFTCGMQGLSNQPFLDISQCMADVGCMPDYPDDGVCLADDSQALQVMEISPKTSVAFSLALIV